MSNQLSQKLKSILGKQSDDLVITKVDHATKTVTVAAASQGLQLPQGVTVNQQALQQALSRQSQGWQVYSPPKPAHTWFPKSSRLAVQQPFNSIRWNTEPVREWLVYDFTTMKSYPASVTDLQAEKLGEADFGANAGHALNRVTDHHVVIGPNGTKVTPERHRWCTDGAPMTVGFGTHYSNEWGRRVSDYENDLLNQHYALHIAQLVVT